MFVEKRPLRLRLAILALFSVALSLVNAPAHAVAPTVVNVTSPTPSGIYGVNDTFTITVQFTQNVFVTDTPTLSMKYSTSQSANATYISGSGTNTLSFYFKAPDGTTSSNLEYASTSALTGTIRNSALEQATLTLPTPGATGSLSANRQIQFENFGNFVSGISSADETIISNMKWSSYLGRPISSDGRKIISLSANLDAKTTILNTNSSVFSLQIYGNYMYWVSDNSLYRSSISSPSEQLLYTHGARVLSVTRTSSGWSLVDTQRNLYLLSADGSYTPTFVANLSASIIDSGAAWDVMHPSSTAGKFLIWTVLSPYVYEINATTGAASIHADISKCGIKIRGLARLDDGSELYSVYQTRVIAHRWPDGRITCSAIPGLVVLMGAMTSDGTNLYASSTYTGAGDNRFLRYTPYNTTWQPASTYDPSITNTSSIEAPFYLSYAASAMKGIPTVIRALSSHPGTVTFIANGKRIAGCIKRPTVSLVASCTWKPTVQGVVRLSASFTPTSESVSPSSSSVFLTNVTRRTTTR